MGGKLFRGIRKIFLTFSDAYFFNVSSCVSDVFFASIAFLSQGSFVLRLLGRRLHESISSVSAQDFRSRHRRHGLRHRRNFIVRKHGARISCAFCAFPSLPFSVFIFPRQRQSAFESRTEE